MPDRPLEAPKASQIVPWSAGLMFLAALFGTHFLFDATWLEALGLGVLFGVACGLGAWRAIPRIQRRIDRGQF